MAKAKTTFSPWLLVLLLLGFSSANSSAALPAESSSFGARAQNKYEKPSGRTSLGVNVAATPDTPTVARSRAADDSNIAAWGDSFTDANYGLYPKTLSQLSGSVVFNGGIGGETSVQIKDRMLAATDKHAWPTIIWAGRNDLSNPAQVKASIAAMVAALKHPNYLVLSVFNGAGEGTGTDTYNQIKALNNELAGLYGSHYLDVRSYIVGQYKPDDAQDAADHTADIPPTSLRQDFLHPNAAGSNLIANYIYANSNQLMRRQRGNSQMPKRGGPQRRGGQQPKHANNRRP